MNPLYCNDTRGEFPPSWYAATTPLPALRPSLKGDQKADVVVVGAGVVGVAVARRFAIAGLEVLLVEKEATFGTGTSSRNSEVIHAGLYYPEGSLKARLCLEGREMLYDYCQAQAIAHKQTGKWVVATGPEQSERLRAIYSRAKTNGCSETYLIPGEAAIDQEPKLNAHEVLVSPRTGVVDSHGLMTTLLGDFERAGGSVVYATPVKSIRPSGGRLQLDLGGQEPSVLLAIDR
ncbi:MAG: FAD-dependent oxidoreductase, partial [Marivivens sp.]|nr:FAD-dependent oxidoreductase [Marivivens sp.]